MKCCLVTKVTLFVTLFSFKSLAEINDFIKGDTLMTAEFCSGTSS